MTKYASFGSTPLDMAGEEILPEMEGSVFSQGLRSGVASTRGQLRALAGGIAEAFGEQDLAQEQYGLSRDAQREAEAVGPAVRSYKDVHDLRSGASYLAGLAGQSVPSLAVGLGAAALTRGQGLRPLAAATGATAPMEIGSTIERQQADPESLRHGAGERLLLATGTGLGSAALQNVVPVAMGGKLLGAGERAAGRSFTSSLAPNLAEAVGGNAAAGAAAEALQQESLGLLNPNRDTSGDLDAIKEAAVGGAVMGAPFGVAGAAGDAMHSRAPASGGKASPADLLSNIRDVFSNKSRDPIDLQEARRIANDDELLDPSVLEGVGPARAEQILAESDQSRMQKVTAWAQDLLSDTSLAPEQKERITAAMSDLGNRANQMLVAGEKVARDASVQMEGKVKDLYASISGKAKTDATRSEANEGIRQQITATIAPMLRDSHPELFDARSSGLQLSDAIAKIVEKARTDGVVSDVVLGKLQNVLGEQTRPVLMRIHDTLMSSGDETATDNFYKVMAKLADEELAQTSLVDAVRSALNSELRNTATPQMLNDAVQHIRDFVAERHTANMTAKQAEVYKRDVRTALEQHFGDKTGALLNAFAEHIKSTNKKEVVDDRAPMTEGENDLTTGDMGDQYEKPRYYGGGRNKSAPEFVERPEIHRTKYNNESPAERLLGKARAENPDRAVDYISARDYAKANSIDDATLTKMTDGRPDDFVMVAAEGMKQEGRLTADELDSMKLDTSKTSHLESKSRIDTGVSGVTLDAKRVVKLMQGKLPYNASDDKSSMHRLARSFMEGLAAAQDNLGRTFDVKDDTVVATRGGKDVTFGELKKLSMRPEDPAWMKDKSPEEINERLRSEEALKTSTDHELKRYRDDLEKIVHRREVAHEEFVRELRENRIKLSKEDFQKTLKDHGLDNANKHVEALRRVKEEIESRTVEGTAKERVLDGSRHGTDVSPDANIHDAATVLGEAGVKRKVGMDDNALRYDTQGKLVNTDHTLSKIGRAAIDSKLNSLEQGKTAAQRKLGEKGRALEAKIDAMAPVDQLRFAKIIKVTDIGEIASVINSLSEKYSGTESAKAKAAPAEQVAPPKSDPAKLDAYINTEKFTSIEDPAKMVRFLNTAQARFKELARLIDERDLTPEESKAHEWGYGQFRNKAADLEMFLTETKGWGALPESEKASMIAEVEGLRIKSEAERRAEERKKQKAFAEQVLSGGKQLDKALADIAKASDPFELRQTVEYLNTLNGNEHSVRAIDAVNKRIGELVAADPQTAYSMLTRSAQKTGQRMISETDESAVRDHIEKVLGKTVQAEFETMFHAGEFIRRDGAGVVPTEDIIRISVYSLDPMSVAHHESLHAFLQKLRDVGEFSAIKTLYKTADSISVRKQLKDLLANEPEALKQIADSVEERAAYMYQFWAAGKLTVGEKQSGVLQRFAHFFRKILGIWSNDERALHIMDYFNAGKYAEHMSDRGAVARALAEGTNPALESFKRMVKPLADIGHALASAGDARLRSTYNPSLIRIADLIHRGTVGEGDDAGFIPAAREKRTQVMNRLTADLQEFNAGTLNQALEALQAGEPAATPEVRLAVRAVRKTLDEMYAYMKEAGVNVGDLGAGKDYFPRVWDPDYLSKHQQEFKDMLQHYVDKGEFSGSRDQVLARLMRQEGSEIGIETSTPGMQHIKERSLKFISGRDAAPFLSKDLFYTLNSYVTQATRRAEWARRFNDDNSGMRSLMESARKKYGATKDDLATAEQYVRAVDGTLGDDLNPTLRRLFGNVIVYQNIRLLPLAIFSSVVDPVGIMVRGGQVSDAWKALKRGVGEVTKNFKKDGGDKDSAYELAETLGVIDNTMLMHTLGSSYTHGMVSSTARKVNDAFFRYNLMEQFNTSMRVAASEAAVRFIGRHAKGDSPHSKRWLGELGLTMGDVIVRDGRVLLRQADFLEYGMSPESAAVTANKMASAVNRWVDGAVLRPNAAHKPIWMNDPHYSLFAHLKQFVYSFHETILKRVAHEVKHGNYHPALALMSYVPVMIGADLIKGMIQGGGSQPDWKENWEAEDYLWSGVQRAGLLGVGQFGVDVVENVDRGGMGVGALTGPTVDQLSAAIRAVSGHGEFGSFILKSMPANALYTHAITSPDPDPIQSR